ncbi:MAG: hypothetical protein Q9163_004175 [Psora crenata]
MGVLKGCFSGYDWCRICFEKSSDMEVERAIDDLPEGLDEAYRRIIDRLQDSLSPHLRKRAFRILYWVCMAFRPVTLHEVVDGITIELSQTILSKRSGSANPQRDIIELCARLLETSSSGILEMVHFSAKEYLIHEQSGRFLDIAQAHIDIAFSRIINLTTSLDLLPGYPGSLSETDIETRIVQGTYGRHAYGHDFWAEHLLAYLIRTKDPSLEARKLTHILEAFSPISKHCTEILISVPPKFNTDTVTASAGLSMVQDMMPKFSTFHSEQQWLLQKDETHLTHIELRLREITDRLCDFLERGFKTRKYLDKHIKSYHLSAKDFEIPTDLHTPGNHAGVGRSVASADAFASSSWSKCWNGRGRQVLQKVFRQVLARVESDMQSKMHDDDPGGRTGTAVNMSSPMSKVDTDHVPTDIERIRDKIERQRYETLAGLRHDLRTLSRAPNSCPVWAVEGDLASICAKEIEKATLGFPNFASFDATPLQSDKSKTPVDGPDNPEAINLESSSEHEETPATCDKSAPDRQATYWSLTEEKEFPKLLQRWGRDSRRIADYLKPKTPGDVDRHLEDLLRTGEARLLQALRDTASKPEADNTESEKRDASDGVGEVLPTLLQSAQHCGFTPFPGDFTTKTEHPTNQSTYVEQKHVYRFHTPTRQVFICDDILPDKSFLTGCRNCSESKCYGSRNMASKHLRGKHFNNETSAEELRGWIRATERPNPNYIPQPRKRQKLNMLSNTIAPLPDDKRQKLDLSSITIAPLLDGAPQANFLLPIITVGQMPISDSKVLLSTSETSDEQEAEDEGSRAPLMTNEQTSENTIIAPGA